MIYEHTSRKRRFVIARATPDAPGGAPGGDQGQWVARCDGAQLVAGPHPEAVLGALLRGDCMPALDGVDPSTLGLPTHLDGWRTGRM